MKKILLALLLSSSVFAQDGILTEYAPPTIDTAINVITYCQDGYKFLIIISRTGTSVVQVFEKVDSQYQPVPVKCEK